MPGAALIKQLAPVRDVGVFKDWRSADTPIFLKYNLIYGFNGSGKTTLSRMLASLEAGRLRTELPEGSTFDVALTDGTLIKSTGTLDALKGRVLVFNVDFIEESFAWKDGKAKPVFYVGREQAALAEELRNTTTAIQTKLQERKSLQAMHAAKEKAFAELKRDAARLIAEQLGLGRKYTAANLTADYKYGPYNEGHKVTEAEIAQIRAILGQDQPLDKRTLLRHPSIKLVDMVAAVERLANTTVGSVTLEDLQGHEGMRDWVLDGLKYHEEKHLSTCLLCGNGLTERRLEMLRSLIDRKYSDLKAEVAACAQSAKSLRIELEGYLPAMPSQNDIALSMRSRFKAGTDEVKRSIRALEQAFTAVQTVLVSKANALQLPADTSQMVNQERCRELEGQLKLALDDVNKAIYEHNAEFDLFASTKEKAAKKLREHYLADYQARFSEAEAETEKAKLSLETLGSELEQLQRKEEGLKRDVRKHGPAATLINSLIHNYLGRNDIELSTREDGYQLRRGGKPVRGSLSEGEKTAIALCYFLSTLEAEGRKRKDLIVVIDDPVSSLDTKALNYAFSIVKSSLGEAGQLFLLTHNLNFMNEAKKWLRPKTEKEVAKRGRPGTGSATLLYLDAIQTGPQNETRSALLKELPTFMREYESEYHYLFYLVANFESSADGFVGYFYLMPNAIRKLLDTFLAFKFPGTEGLSNKIENVAKLNHGLDTGRIRALERLAQVESHADNIDDLVTFSSMTIEETKDAAKTLLKLMESLDGDHYKRMNSIIN